MRKLIFLILFAALTLNGCAVITWNHPTKGHGKISTMRDPKGSNEFIRDYDDCKKIAAQYVNSMDKVTDPCLADREHTKCMKNKYGWKLEDTYIDQ